MEIVNMNKLAKTFSNNQHDFVPISIDNVSFDILQNIQVYIQNPDGSFSLYNNDELGINREEYNKLIENDTRFIYIQSCEFLKYYDLFSNCIQPVMQDKTLPLEKRVQFFYETTIALAQKIIDKPFSKQSTYEALQHSHKVINTLCTEKDAVYCLLKNADRKEHDVAVHMANNSILMMSFALKAGLVEKNTLAVLGAGAMLEDIGKILLPSEILEKTEKLTKQERIIVENHVQLGVNHLKIIDDLDDEILNIVKYHHERYDGSGYPEQLKADQIPLMGQVAGLIDCFEAMISIRPYRSNPLTAEQALNEMETSLKDKFDPDLLKCFSGFVKYHLLDDKQITEEEMLNCDISALRILDRKSNPSGRRHDREYVRKPGEVTNLSYKEEKWESLNSSDITVYNISRSGIGFLSQTPFEENKLVQIKVDVDEKEIQLVAKTVHTSYHQRDWYTIGASFLRTHTRTEFRKLMQQLSCEPMIAAATECDEQNQ